MIKRKSLTTVLLSLVALLCFAFGSVGFINTNSAQASGNPDYLSSFKMLEGAEIRTAEPNGIRFTTEISAEQYNALTEKIGTEYKNVEFGALVCPTDLIPAGGLTMANAEVENSNVKIVRRTTWDAEFNPELETDVYQYNTDIIDIKPENLTKEFQALGYVTLFPYEGDAVTYYATVTNNGNVRTPFGVATTLISRGSEDAYILGIVDSVMEGKTLTLNATSVDTKWNESTDLALVATVDGVEVPVEYSVANSSIATYENGKVFGKKPGSTKIVATLKGAAQNYTAEVIVNNVVDVSAFENKGSSSRTDNGKTLTYTAYVEQGVGTWVYGVAEHRDSWWGNSFHVYVGSTEAYFTRDGGVNNFDASKSIYWFEANPAGGYFSYFVGLVPESVVSTANGFVYFTGVFEFAEEGGSGLGIWWSLSQGIVCSDGFLGDIAPKGNVKAVDFVEETNKAFEYTASLNSGGLYIEAVAKTDASDETLLGFEITRKLWSSSDGGKTEQWFGKSAGNTPTWKSVTSVENANAATDGYARTITYKIFLDYTYLKNLGVSYNFNSANPIESTVYINVAFWAEGNDIMKYNYTKEDGTAGTRTSGTYGWCCYNWWAGGHDANNIKYARALVTKNGIIN